MSPEVLNDEYYDEKTDIWFVWFEYYIICKFAFNTVYEFQFLRSLGCILYEMCTFKRAFESKGYSFVDKILYGDPPQLPSKFSPDLSVIYKKYSVV